MDENSDVIEGFLCPVCMKDLKSSHQLLTHFEEEHSEDKAVLQSLKGLITRAKKKLLKEDGSENEFEASSVEKQAFIDTNNSFNWEAPYECRHKSHTDLFRRLRSTRIDSYVAETNKLLIRLDKLLTNIPSDPVKRKAHEKSVVEWADDKDVPLCPFCANFFNVTKRRHHCRLCGAVMCHDCSQFLPFSLAEKLVYIIRKGEKEKQMASPKGKSLSNTLLPLLKRTGSQGSLNSVISLLDSQNKDQFRICAHCYKRLETRNQQVEIKNCKPLISIYYQKLSKLKNQLIQYASHYRKIADGLSQGDPTFQLAEGMELRLKILKISDEINVISVKIRNLDNTGTSFEENVPCGSTDNQPGPRQEMLQKRIHSCLLTFLKENVLSLPKLPNEDELHEIIQRKRNEAEARNSAGRDKSTRSLSKKSANSSFSESPNIVKRSENVEFVENSGWGGKINTHDVTETDDPLIQQMNIIRTYIKQAKEARRHDDAHLLEQNLKELRIEYLKQKYSS